MKWIPFVFVALVVPLLGGSLQEPGVALAPGKNDAEWLPLFAELGSRRTVVSSFTEHRWFPFKKIPVVLKGVMRLSPDLGMSLGYIEPEKRTVVIDAKGLLLRDANGRQREIPVDPNTPAASTALLPILNFDWKKLDEAFVVSAVRDGEQWRLDFVPRDPQLADKLGRIIATGEGLMMRHLEFRRSAMQRVEIIIGETRQGGEFSAGDKKAYFR
jgi:hypothetical protein